MFTKWPTTLRFSTWASGFLVLQIVICCAAAAAYAVVQPTEASPPRQQVQCSLIVFANVFAAGMASMGALAATVMRCVLYNDNG